MGSFPIARRTKVSANPHLVDVFRRPRITGVVSGAMPLQRWELGFRQSSFHRIVRVLRCEALNAFETTTASTTCYCSLRLSPSGKSLTQEHSFELLLPGGGILGCAYPAHVGRANGLGSSWRLYSCLPLTKLAGDSAQTRQSKDILSYRGYVLLATTDLSRAQLHHMTGHWADSFTQTQPYGHFLTRQVRISLTALRATAQ